MKNKILYCLVIILVFCSNCKRKFVMVELNTSLENKTITIKNLSANAITILQTRVSCSCIIIDSLINKVINPFSEIKVNYKISDKSKNVDVIDFSILTNLNPGIFNCKIQK